MTDAEETSRRLLADPRVQAFLESSRRKENSKRTAEHYEAVLSEAIQQEREVDETEAA